MEADHPLQKLARSGPFSSEMREQLEGERERESSHPLAPLYRSVITERDKVLRSGKVLNMRLSYC